jgi:hypothetical protein
MGGYTRRMYRARWEKNRRVKEGRRIGREGGRHFTRRGEPTVTIDYISIYCRE